MADNVISKKGAVTRKAIVQESLQLIFELGIEKFTFQQLAAKVGLSQPAIYKYFDDKLDLLLACCEHSASEGRQYIDNFINKNAPAPKRLESYIEGNLKWISNCRVNAYTLIALYYFSQSSEKIKKLHLAIEDVGLARIQTLIIQGKHEKCWELSNPTYTAKIIRNLLVGEMLQTFYSPRAPKIDERVKALNRTILKMLRASI